MWHFYNKWKQYLFTQDIYNRSLYIYIYSLTTLAQSYNIIYFIILLSFKELGEALSSLQLSIITRIDSLSFVQDWAVVKIFLASIDVYQSVTTVCGQVVKNMVHAIMRKLKIMGLNQFIGKHVMPLSKALHLSVHPFDSVNRHCTGLQAGIIKQTC